MTMILTEDLEKSLMKYDDDIYKFVKMNDDSYDELRKCITNTLKFYELSDKDDSFSLSKMDYLFDYINHYFDKKVNEFRNRIENRVDILRKMELLKLLKLPEQRSEEWYKIRKAY